MKYILSLLLFFFGFLVPSIALGSEFDGASLGLIWGIPFVGILLSIALIPLISPNIWHHHFGKIIAVWCVLFLVPFVLNFGIGQAVQVVVHALLAEYIPFIILLLSLFTVSGGIYIQGDLQGSPKLNISILAIGTVLASFMGTTGAAMLLIRPLLRANEHRQHKVHVVVFFIFLVANIGGSLTPLGDPPLFLGFLKGVDFFWTIKYMLLPVCIASIILLALFYFIDRYYFQQESKEQNISASSGVPFRIVGLFNFILLACIIFGVLLSGFWKPGIHFNVVGTTVELQNIVRDILLLGIVFISLYTTDEKIHKYNEFNWEPMLEVGKLFAGIFLTIAPVLAILKAGSDGEMRALVALVADAEGAPINAMYFWMTGVLSAFLDNAPTYLVFFNLASGDAAYLMEHLSGTLLAISMGSVFMGAITYIGNAPNFMVKSIASQRGVNMPSFFGYMKWSVSLLIPVFLLLTVIFFI